MDQIYIDRFDLDGEFLESREWSDDLIEQIAQYGYTKDQVETWLLQGEKVYCPTCYYKWRY